MKTIAGDSLSITQKTLILMILACAIYFPFFWRLTAIPLNIWDEGRVAANAIGMLNHKSFWIAYFGDETEMWNLKPPLLPWLQIISFQIFGYSSLGVRFPSAFSGVLLCIGFVFFSHRHLKSIIPGVLASMVLATATGFACNHVARTGDYDALLGLCITGYALFFYLFTASGYYKKKYLYLFALFLILAVYTKGAAGFLGVPGLVIYTFWRGNPRRLLKMPSFYVALLLFVIITGAYYAIREYHTPGYLFLIWNGEYMGVPVAVIQGHSGPWYYYLEALIVTRFYFYFAIFELSVVVSFLAKLAGPYKRFMQFASVMAISILLFISLMVSKLPWYDVPVFPFAAVLIGCLMYIAWKVFSLHFKKGFTPLLTWMACLGFFAVPYWQIIQNIQNETVSTWDQVWFSEFMQKLEKDHPEWNKYVVAVESSLAGQVFYREVLKRKGFDIAEKDFRREFVPGEEVLFCEYSVEKALQERYELEYKEQLKMCRFAVVKRKKDTASD